MNRRRVAAAIGAAFLACSTLAAAQTYPAKPIRWVLGFPGGGTSDIIARALGQKMGESLGQQFIIDNRPGASGIIANQMVARAPADGYTILLISSTYANLISAQKKLPYEPSELAPVTLIASVPNILSVHPSLPVTSVKELVALAKRQPGQINYGTGGPGTGPHLASELFKLMTGTDIVHVPYKGTPPAVTDLMAGRVQMMFALSPVAMPHVKSGKIRPLAVSGAKRMPELPNLPTVGETVRGYEATTWYGLLVPRATPRPIIDLLNKELAKAIAVPSVAEQLVAAGFVPETSTPEGFTKYMDNEVAKWGKVIKAANIQME